MQNVIVGVAGMKGHGKSTYLRNMLQDEPALALVDTLGEHSAWCEPFPSPLLEDQVLFLAGPPPSFRHSFVLPAGKELEPHFNFLCRAAYISGGMTVAVEEVDYFSSSGSDAEGLELLIRYGRHRGVNLVWVARNLVEVSRRLTSQTDAYVLFRTQEPRYIEGLGERLTPEIAREVEQLPQFEYIVCSKDTEPVRGRVTP